MINWNPYQTFVWSRKQIAEWFDTNGASCFYDGRLWALRSKSLGAGRYKAWFEEV